MWARLLFAIRSRVPDPISALGSWKLSIVLTVSGSLYFALLASWSTSSPPSIVQGIAGLLPFWVLYGLLLVNTALCLWQRLPLMVIGIRSGRWEALGTYLFHGAFFLLAFAVGLTMLFRQEMTLRVAEGEDFIGTPEQIASRSRPAVFNPPAAPLEFRLEQVAPEFWGDQLLFTQLQADLVFASGKRRRTRINRPLWVGPATFLRMSGFGYTPRYEVADSQGRVIESLFVKLTVFPPGIRDSFNLERFPHRVEMGITPDAVEEGGRLISRTLNLNRPVVSAQVSRGKIILAEEDLGLGEKLEFEGMSLSFPEIRYWGEFSVVRDPGVPVLFSAFALAIVGLLLKLRNHRPAGGP